MSARERDNPELYEPPVYVSTDLSDGPDDHDPFCQSCGEDIPDDGRDVCDVCEAQDNEDNERQEDANGRT